MERNDPQDSSKIKTIETTMWYCCCGPGIIGIELKYKNLHTHTHNEPMQKWHKKQNKRNKQHGGVTGGGKR